MQNRRLPSTLADRPSKQVPRPPLHEAIQRYDQGSLRIPTEPNILLKIRRCITLRQRHLNKFPLMHSSLCIIAMVFRLNCFARRAGRGIEILMIL